MSKQKGSMLGRSDSQSFLKVSQEPNSMPGGALCVSSLRSVASEGSRFSALFDCWKTGSSFPLMCFLNFQEGCNAISGQSDGWVRSGIQRAKGEGGRKAFATDCSVDCSSSRRGLGDCCEGHMQSCEVLQSTGTRSAKRVTTNLVVRYFSTASTTGQMHTIVACLQAETTVQIFISASCVHKC